MNSVVLTFNPAGDGSCLYTESIDLSSLGRLEIHRATNIEFNNGNQKWEVKDLEGKVMFRNSSRQVCLEWERENFVG